MIRGVRAQGSLFGSSTLTPPWSLHFVDGAPLTLCAVLGGGGWVVPEGHPPEPLRPGDTGRVRGVLHGARGGRHTAPPRVARPGRYRGRRGYRRHHAHRRRLPGA